MASEFTLKSIDNKTTNGLPTDSVTSLASTGVYGNSNGDWVALQVGVSGQLETSNESIYADGEIVDNDFFEISSTGQIKLKDGVSIDADTYSSFELEVIIVDQANDQISRHCLPFPNQ